MMSAARSAAQRVLTRHRAIISATPVPILRMAEDDGWFINFEPLHDFEGIAVVLEGVKVMTVNSRLSPQRQRGVVAHELGHHERDDASSLPFQPVRYINTFGIWLHDRAERGAWEVAANILVPIDMLDGLVHATVDDIARACDVPPELVVLALGEPW